MGSPWVACRLGRKNKTGRRTACRFSSIIEVVFRSLFVAAVHIELARLNALVFGFLLVGAFVLHDVYLTLTLVANFLGLCLGRQYRVVLVRNEKRGRSQLTVPAVFFLAGCQ